MEIAGVQVTSGRGVGYTTQREQVGLFGKLDLPFKEILPVYPCVQLALREDSMGLCMQI